VSKAQALTEAILADQTTALSSAIDSVVMDSVVYGTGGKNVMTITASGAIGIGSNNVNPLYKQPRPLPELTLETLETHPIYQLTREQMRAAWLLQHGHRWVEIHTLATDDDALLLHRMEKLGMVELQRVNHWDMYARIVE